MYFPLGRRRAEFSLQSLWSICMRNLFQLLSFNTAEFWKMPEPANIFEDFQMHRPVQEFHSWILGEMSRCDQSNMAWQSNTILPSAMRPTIYSRPTFRELTSIFRGPPIPEWEKVQYVNNTIRCKRYHRQLELISRHSVLTHWKCFVDIKVVDSLACGLVGTH